MELKDIKELIALMKKNDLSVFKMENEGFKITLKKGVDFQTAHTQPLTIPAAQVAVLAPAAAPEPAETPDKSKEIASPMVGTFYGSPSPDSASFVEVGQTIAPGDVVCIIEAMKVMNEIKAEIGGTVTEISAENGKPVQFGQALFKVK